MRLQAVAGVSSQSQSICLHSHYRDYHIGGSGVQHLFYPRLVYWAFAVSCILRHFRDILPWLYLPQHLLHLVPITSGLPQRYSLVLSRTTGRRGSTSSVRLPRSINGLPRSKSSLSAWHLPGTLSHIISPYRPGPGMVPWLHSLSPGGSFRSSTMSRIASCQL